MKKIFLLFLMTVLLINNAYAFTFPTPDWGQLLKEKEKMVTETDFDLYAQGSVDSSLYYGAKFEPKAGTYLGTVAEKAHNYGKMSCYLTYIADMNQPDLYYPANERIKNDDVISLIGWTINDMSKVDYGKVKSVLDTLNSYNKPMLIRFANEMNCSSLGNDPQKYIEVFRKVADMIHQYENFGVVWSPNDMGALDRPFEYFYPGDKYVDWVGVSCYSIKYFQGKKDTAYKDSVYFMTGDYAWATNRIKPFMEYLKKNNIKKPVMISEGGVSTSNKFGENLESWSEPRLRNMLWYVIMKYPQIKMINYFDVYRENVAEKFEISNYNYSMDIFKQALNSGAYITEYGKNPSFVFKKANDAGTLSSKDGIIKLYTLAHIPGQHNISVNYHIDSKWYHSSNQIPYICNMNIKNISDGKHTLTISSMGQQKEYIFYKKGNYIKFGAQPQVEISVTINGKKVNFDQPPVEKNGRTLVPLRAIFENLGATVNWNDVTQTVTSTKGDISIKLTIGSNKLYVNEKEIVLDVPAQLINSRTFVPVRAVAEAFKCNVDWDDQNKTVIIKN